MDTFVCSTGISLIQVIKVIIQTPQKGFWLQLMQPFRYIFQKCVLLAQCFSIYILTEQYKRM